MDTENSFFKTAELVRDVFGCYYFRCLLHHPRTINRCEKYFENLDDTVDHIEKYFYESSDDNDLLTDLLTPMAINESEWMVNNDIVNNDDVDTVVANIKKESLEEYEDYKLSSPQLCQDYNQPLNDFSVYCPICAKTLKCSENSLESHLMTVHHRSKNHAKIYECKICGRNTFTRSYDLERHKLIHARYSDATEASTVIASEHSKSESDTAVKSVLFNILSDKEPVSETIKDPNENNAPNVSIVPSIVESARRVPKRKFPFDECDFKIPQKEIKLVDRIDNHKAPSQPTANKPPFCPICQLKCPKNETLESHLIRVHHRHKQYANIYECTTCGKNTFTRPYDLRRHELIHERQNSSLTLPDFQPKIEKTVIRQVPSAKKPAVASDKKPEASSVKKPEAPSIKTPIKNIETNKIPTEIHTTNPKKNGILCAVCNKKFGSYLDVTMHLKFAHNQKRIYKCRHLNCGDQSFTNSFALHRHELSHSVHYRNIVGINQNRMKCVFCRRSFNKRWNLMKHEKRHLLETAQG